MTGRGRGRGGPANDQIQQFDKPSRGRGQIFRVISGQSNALRQPNLPRTDSTTARSSDQKFEERSSIEGGERTSSGLNGRCERDRSTPESNSLTRPQEQRVSEQDGEGTSPGRCETNRLIPESILLTRPQDQYVSKQGTSGNKVMVKSNYFKLITLPEWTLYHYSVDMSPEEDCTPIRRRLLRVHSKTIGGYIFDGKNLYTTTKLSPKQMVLSSKREGDDVNVILNLKLVNDITPGDYAYIQVFNILMRKCYAALKLQLIGRDFYDEGAKIYLKDEKLQIWPGYKTTIAQHESSILMVVEIIHKIIRIDSVLDYLIDIRQQGRNFRTIFNRNITGQIVLTYYNNRTYLINDVDWDSTPESTFAYNGENISYIKYYKQRYNITIRDHNQPLLVSLPKKKDISRGLTGAILLIPELCRMTGLSDRMRNNFRLMQTLSEHTRIDPVNRIRMLLAFNKRLQETSECIDELQNWNMKLDSNLVEIEARKLPNEDIYQGRGTIRYSAGDTCDGWTKNLYSNPFVSSAPVKNWAVIISGDNRDDSTIDFIYKIRKVANGMAFNLPEPNISYVSEENLGDYVAEIERVALQNPSIILFCIKSNRLDLYSAIKKKCCVDRAIPSQVVTARSICNRSSTSIATKIAIQMNCKLGGAPWTTPQPIKNLMVIGYDVCHDPQNRSNTFGAMVSSVNPNQTKYFSNVTRHSNGEEIGTEFHINMELALQKYRVNNKQELPDVIIFYRDGVGVGQIAQVLQHEVETIKNVLKANYKTKQYKLQYVIVSKRLNTRFFISNTNKNPQPGTVVDDVVTNPNRYDFFLISQNTRNGTIVPTSYNIIFDNTGLTPDRSQILAYKFCHMYYNISTQIGVPGPCQYAHKLAFLASQNLHNKPNPSLSSVLFYL